MNGTSLGTWATYVGIGAGIAAMLTVASKAIRRVIFAPIFWIFRRLVSEPVTAWAKHVIGGIVDERLKVVDDKNIKRLDVINRNVTSVKEEVKTKNAQTIAELADADESRRIEPIPEAERTPLERSHMHETSD